MATMLIPGHDRDAIVPVQLTVAEAVAMSDEQLAEFDVVELVDEYMPTPEDEATVRMFISLCDDVPDVVGYQDARAILDQLAYDEWAAAA